MYIRDVLRLSFLVALAGGLATRPAAALQYLQSEVSAYAEASSQLCSSYSTGDVGSTRYACSQNNAFNLAVEESDSTDSSNALSVGGTGSDYGYFVNNEIGIVSIPGGPLAARARAQSDPFENRAYISTTAFSSVSGGEDLAGTGNETRYNDSYATANALSIWAEEITFTGGVALGQGAMQFAISGNISVSSSNSFIQHEGPEGERPSFGPSGGSAGANEMLFAIDVFDSENNFVSGATYRAYSNGSIDDTLNVFVPFTYGETYTFVGSLSVSGYGYGLNQISCVVLPGGGRDCTVNGSEHEDGSLDFESTVSVSKLIVPPGTTALGTGGSALPFAVVVPEPTTAALFGAGLAALGARGRRRTRMQSTDPPSEPPRPRRVAA